MGLFKNIYLLIHYHCSSFIFFSFCSFFVRFLRFALITQLPSFQILFSFKLYPFLSFFTQPPASHILVSSLFVVKSCLCFQQKTVLRWVDMGSWLWPMSRSFTRFGILIAFQSMYTVGCLRSVKPAIRLQL